MIKTKRDLAFYLAADKFALGINRRFPAIQDDVWRYQIILRKLEYYTNCNQSLFTKVMQVIYKVRKHKMGIKLGFDIPVNVFGAGLRINHFGLMVVNSLATVGRWCDIHQGTNIGVNNSKDGEKLVPIIGDNVWVGPGAKLFGDIKVGNGVVIGANSVVNKGCPDNVTIVGSPARVVKEEGSESVDVAANINRTKLFFQQNPQFKDYE